MTVARPEAVDRPRIIVDCDPGHDDVAALATAAGTCEIVAVTTVAGNAPLAHCTTNALTTIELLGVDVEVHPGADRPLVRAPRHARDVHGPTGLVGVEVPPPSRSASPVTAVEALLELTRREEGLWIVPIGPLTNVALALRADPGFRSRIAGISLMGGGIARGNVTATAEFNLWFDPDAASIVFDAGAPVRMCGLDVTQQVLVDDAFVGRIRGIHGAAAAFLGDVLAGYVDTCESNTGRRAGALHDPCAVIALVAPQLFDFASLSVVVERTGVTAGMTVADRRDVARSATVGQHSDVALEVDAPNVVDLVAASVAATPDARGHRDRGLR